MLETLFICSAYDKQIRKTRDRERRREKTRWTTNTNNLKALNYATLSGCMQKDWALSFVYMYIFVRSPQRSHLMYSNLHTPKLQTPNTVHQIAADTNNDTQPSRRRWRWEKKRQRKKHILQTPVYWKHPKCSYRLLQHVVWALPFQKCTVNLIIQIENNWINQPRKPFIVKYCWWLFDGGGDVCVCVQAFPIDSMAKTDEPDFFLAMA